MLLRYLLPRAGNKCTTRAFWPRGGSREPGCGLGPHHDHDGRGVVLRLGVWAVAQRELDDRLRRDPGRLFGDGRILDGRLERRREHRELLAVVPHAVAPITRQSTDASSVNERIDGSQMISFVISLFVDLTIDAFRPQLTQHVDRALARLQREKKEAQRRIERVISRCVGAAIASMKLKHITERREQLDERRRRAELEEEAARQAKLKAERLARAAAPPKRTPKAPVQARRAARAVRLPPPAVEATLKSARPEAAKDHEKYLKDREAERVAELEELAEKVRIGARIAHGD